MKMIESSLLLPLLLLTILVVVSAAATNNSNNDDEAPTLKPVLEGITQAEYGVDYSFPMHYPTAKNAAENPLGDKQAFYKKHMKGCNAKYKKLDADACLRTERDRIYNGRNQPSRMTNYTETGFLKVKAPRPLYDILVDFYEQYEGDARDEGWDIGNTYTNHWESSTKMVSIDEFSYKNKSVKDMIFHATRPLLEKWVNKPLEPSACYGIRVYTSNSVLATHVDTIPRVTSAIINVAQDVDEPWPLEVIGHDGLAYNITMQPGEMILYESHSILHGRPFPLQGRYYANAFVHFHPVMQNNQQDPNIPRALPPHQRVWGKSDMELYEHALSLAPTITPYSDEDMNDLLPYYINEQEEARWRGIDDDNDGDQIININTENNDIPRPNKAHTAASYGDLGIIKGIAARNPRLLLEKDENGWQPIHEAARSGHTDILRVIVEAGADVNARTNDGKGETPLWWAQSSNGPDHESANYLKSAGGRLMKPGKTNTDDSENGGDNSSNDHGSVGKGRNGDEL